MEENKRAMGERGDEKIWEICRMFFIFIKKRNLLVFLSLSRTLAFVLISPRVANDTFHLKSNLLRRLI